MWNLVPNLIFFILESLDYKGMIHLAYLVAKRGDYSHFDLEKRKSIFWAIFYFSNRVKDLKNVHTFLKKIKNFFIKLLIKNAKNDINYNG